MLRIILFSCFLFPITANAQISKKAVYDMDVYNLDTVNITPEFILRYVTNNSDLLCYCNSKYNKIREVSSINKKEVKVNRKNIVQTHQEGDAYRVIDYDAGKEVFFEDYNKKKKITCLAIDKSKLDFIRTTETKKINAWNCIKYISSDTLDRDVIIWVSDSLPYYVNPGIFLANIENGIVCVEFIKKGAITLKALENSTTNPAPYKYTCTNSPDRKYNLLDTEIRGY